MFPTPIYTLPAIIIVIVIIYRSIPNTMSIIGVTIPAINRVAAATSTT
jgi:hypothetical protein